MSIQHRLYFKSCFICQTNEEGKWGLEPYDLASLVVINPIHRERNMLYLLLHPFRRMRATSPEGGSFAENKEKILNLICFCPFVPHPLPYSLPHLGRRVLVGCSDSTQESGLWNIERASCFMYTLNFSHVKSRQFPLPAFLK